MILYVDAMPASSGKVNFMDTMNVDDGKKLHMLCIASISHTSTFTCYLLRKYRYASVKYPFQPFIWVSLFCATIYVLLRNQILFLRSVIFQSYENSYRQRVVIT